MLDVFAGNFLSFIFGLLTLILAPFLVGIANKLLKMANINLGAAQEALLRNQIDNLLIATEEWAQSRVKASIPTTANDKVQHFLANAVDKIPGITAEEAFQFSQEQLPKLMLGAAGAFQELTKLTKTEPK